MKRIFYEDFSKKEWELREVKLFRGPAFVKAVRVEDGQEVTVPEGRIRVEGGDPNEWPADLRVRGFPNEEVYEAKVQ